MDTAGWAWVIVNGSDADYWEEEAELDRWMDAGSPPAHEWRGEPAPEVPSRPGSVEVPERALTVTREVAAALLSVSTDTLDRHVIPHLRVLTVGRRQVIPVTELQAFVNDRAARR